jgi:hypothetical protein
LQYPTFATESRNQEYFDDVEARKYSVARVRGIRTVACP